MAVSLVQQHLYPGQGGVGGYGVPKPAVHPFSVLGNPTSRLPEGPGYTPVGGGGAPEVAPPGVFNPTGVATQAPSYGTAGGGGSGVDWTGLIGGSWEVSQAQAMMAEQMARARSNLTADLRQNFIDLGIGNTKSLGSLGSYIDKGTIQQAINNKYSVYGQVGLQEAKANAQNAAGLAARGMGQSGQSTTNAESVINQGEQARYMGLREFLRSGQTGLEHLGDVQSQMSQGVMNAQFSAANRIAQQNAAAAALAAAQGAYGGPSAAGGGPAPTIPTDGYSPYVDPNFPGGPAAPNYPLVGTGSPAWLQWLREHGTSGY